MDFWPLLWLQSRTFSLPCDHLDLIGPAAPRGRKAWGGGVLITNPSCFWFEESSSGSWRATELSRNVSFFTANLDLSKPNWLLPGSELLPLDVSSRPNTHSSLHIGKHTGVTQLCHRFAFYSQTHTDCWKNPEVSEDMREFDRWIICTDKHIPDTKKKTFVTTSFYDRRREISFNTGSLSKVFNNAKLSSWYIMILGTNSILEGFNHHKARLMFFGVKYKGKETMCPPSSTVYAKHLDQPLVVGCTEQHQVGHGPM